MKKLERMDGEMFQKLSQNQLSSMFGIVGGTKTATIYLSAGTRTSDCRDDQTQTTTLKNGNKVDIKKGSTCSPQQITDHADSIGVSGTDFSLTADSGAPCDDFNMIIKMKHIIFCIIYFSISLNLHGQTDSLAKFNLIITNSTLSYVNKDYKSCVEKILEAQAYKELLPYSHLILAECYLSLNDSAKAVIEIQNAIYKGVTDDLLRNRFDLFKRPNGNNRWLTLIKNYPTYRAIYLASLDWDIKVILERIIAIDQSIRISEKSYADAGCNPVNLYNMIDSINYIDFMNLTITNGFPTYKQIGFYSSLDVLLAHWILEDSRYNTLNDLMLNAIYSGQFEPDSYAWIIDRRIIWKNLGKAVYGGYEDPETFGEIDDIKNVDKRRASIFIQSLELDSKITNRQLPKDYKSQKK
ncbi:MAG: hypothetical protein SGJ00_11940 [bacterium]|nr:hypothetical protein [bacterium]